jgi:multimeric flavodoxin WrbA
VDSANSQEFLRFLKRLYRQYPGRQLHVIMDNLATHKQKDVPKPGEVMREEVMAINASPRKEWNTATLLKWALRGAEGQGARTKMIHLYDLDFKGCTSCFACKRKETYRQGLCAMRDGLTPVLQEVMTCKAIFLGSPIYLADVTGAMRSFLERLLFMNLSYDQDARYAREKELSFGLIYTMNQTREKMEELGYPAMFDFQVRYLRALKGQVEYITSCDTWQFDDYSR